MWHTKFQTLAWWQSKSEFHLVSRFYLITVFCLWGMRRTDCHDVTSWRGKFCPREKKVPLGYQPKVMIVPAIFVFELNKQFRNCLILDISVNFKSRKWRKYCDCDQDSWCQFQKYKMAQKLTCIHDFCCQPSHDSCCILVPGNCL